MSGSDGLKVSLLRKLSSSLDSDRMITRPLRVMTGSSTVLTPPCNNVLHSGAAWGSREYDCAYELAGGAFPLLRFTVIQAQRRGQQQGKQTGPNVWMVSENLTD